MSVSGARVLGVDGCPGGWIGALVDDRSVRWRHYPGIEAGLAAALAEDAAVVAIDMPIGLPRPGREREADLAARAALGPRRSSVFLAPWRALLTASGQPAASAASRARTGKGISVQAFGIYPRIAAADRLIGPSDQGRVIEAHPELAFLRLAGDVGSKHSAAGLARRVAALTTVMPPFEVSDRTRPATVADAVDALACAVTARHWLTGQVVLFPPTPPRDARGLYMGVCG